MKMTRDLNIVTCGDMKRINILEFIIEYLQAHGYCPSFREIGDAVGLHAISTIQHHINIMVENGMLETDPEVDQPRSLRVPGYKFVKCTDRSRIR